jgi:hypothetical protein
MIQSRKFSAAREMGCFESPDCEPFFTRRAFAGVSQFVPGKTQTSKTAQSAANSQTGVQGGANTVGVGSGNSGAVATNGGIALTVNSTRNTSKSTTGAAASFVPSINVSSNVTNDTVTNSDADAPQFLSVIDHLVTAVTTPPETPQSSTATASQAPLSGTPVISTTGDEIQAGSGLAPSNNLVNWVIIVGGILTLVVFLKSRGKSA